jgi:hypothetical protein
LEVYPVLKPIGDIETCRFADWRSPAVALRGERSAFAVYGRPGEAWLLLANLEGAPRDVECAVRPEKLPFPLPSISAADLIRGGDRGDAATAVEVSRLVGDGVKIALPADGVVLLHIR